MIRQRIFLLLIVSVIFACMAMAVLAGSHNKSSAIPGSILINIRTYDNFTEFKWQSGNLVKTTAGKIVKIEKDGRTQFINMSDDFEAIFRPNRLYRYNMEEKLAGILAQYNLEEFDDLRKRFVKSRGKLEKERYSLTGPGKELPYFQGKYAYHFIPNRQLSHVIYYHHSFAGALIDINAKDISFPFGLDGLEHLEWDQKGQYVAYSIQVKNGSKFTSTLVIQDISKNKVVLRKHIARIVSDIAWAPDSSCVALLTYDASLSLLSPRAALGYLIGHPIFNCTFYLEIYDLSGNLLCNEQVNGEFKNSEGHIVWIP